MDVATESNENSPDESERRRKSERRTSILKPPKPRNPLQELDFDKEANETVQPTRRVSFSRAQIKEFAQSRGQDIWGPTYYVDVCQSDSSIKNATSSDAAELDQDFQFESKLSDNVHLHRPSVKEDNIESYQKEQLTNCSDCIYIDRNTNSRLTLNSRMEITDCVENCFNSENSIIHKDINETEKTINVNNKSNMTKIFNSSSEDNSMELTMKTNVTRQSLNVMLNSENCTKIFDCSSFSNKINLTGDYGIVVCDSINGSKNSNDLELCDSIMNDEETGNNIISNNLCAFGIKSTECSRPNNCTNTSNISGADNSLPLSVQIGGIIRDSGAFVSKQGNAMSCSNKIETIEGPFETAECEISHLTVDCGGIANNDLFVEPINDYQVKISNEVSLGNKKVIKTYSKTSALSPENLNVVVPQLDASRSMDTEIVSLTEYNPKSLCALSKEIGSEPTIVNQETQNLNTHNDTHLEDHEEKFSLKESMNPLVIESKNFTNENSELLNTARDLRQNNSCTLSTVNLQEANIEYMDVVTNTHFEEAPKEPSISSNEISNNKATVNREETAISNCNDNFSLANKSSNMCEFFLEGNNSCCDANKLESCNKFTCDRKQNFGETENCNRIFIEESPRTINAKGKENVNQFVNESKNISNESLELLNNTSDLCQNNLCTLSIVNVQEANNEYMDVVTDTYFEESQKESRKITVPVFEIINYSNENENFLNQTSNFHDPNENINCKIHAVAPNLRTQLIENGDSELKLMNNSSETSIILETSRKRRNVSSYYLAPEKKNITENDFGVAQVTHFDNGIQYLEDSKEILSSNGHFDKSWHSALSPKHIFMKSNKKLNDCKTQEGNTHRDILDMQKFNSDLGNNFTDNHKHHEVYIENESILKDPSISSSSPDDDSKFGKEITISPEMKDVNAFKNETVESVASWGTRTNIIGAPLNLAKQLIERVMIPTVGFCSMENICLTESEKQEIKSNVRRKVSQNFSNLESLKEQYEEISKKIQILVNKIQLNSEKQKNYGRQSVDSDCNFSSFDMNIVSNFDNTLYLTKGPPSAMDCIISFKESNKCLWELERMSEKEWFFSFYHNTFTLLLLLEDKLITEIKFLPMAVGDDQILKFIQHVVIKSFSSDKILAMCKTESDVMHLLNEISRKIEDMLTFKWDIELLQDCHKLEFVSNCASLKFTTFKSLLRFNLTIDFNDWDKIQPEHISVEDYYGNLRVQDVVNLSSGIQKDSHFLINYIKSIHDYLKLIDKYSQC